MIDQLFIELKVLGKLLLIVIPLLLLAVVMVGGLIITAKGRRMLGQRTWWE